MTSLVNMAITNEILVNFFFVDKYLLKLKHALTIA